LKFNCHFNPVDLFKIPYVFSVSMWLIKIEELKVMLGTVNANREYFESAVKDLSQAKLEYGDWLDKLLTHPVKGLENYGELFEKLTTAKGAIKVFCEVSSLEN
jgi:threonine dehydrogenase-like Zn-dependent dehydrogenase